MRLRASRKMGTYHIWNMYPTKTSSKIRVVKGRRACFVSWILESAGILLNRKPGSLSLGISIRKECVLVGMMEEKYEELAIFFV